jgi:hypothetical protein
MKDGTEALQNCINIRDTYRMARGSPTHQAIIGHNEVIHEEIKTETTFFIASYSKSEKEQRTRIIPKHQQVLFD